MSSMDETREDHPPKARSPALYLPVEDRHREFDAKLLVAAAAAERGLIAIVGQQALLTQFLGAWVPGIFVAKGLNRVQRRFVDAARRFGHLVAVIDEEAMGVADPDYMAKDVDPAIDPGGLLVLAQGEVHAAMLRDRRGFPAGAVAVTGNPRLDLLRPPLNGAIEDEAAAIRDRFGPFVLANTNTCAVNSAWGDLSRYRHLCEGIGWVRPGDPAEEAMWDLHVAHDRASEAAMIEAIGLLRKRLPGHAIVVRPHPSERLETWVDRFAGTDRVHVIREGSHLPWMRAADLTIHTSCTTGLEADLAGCRAISLVPEGAVAAHWYLSNLANLRAPSAEAVATLATRLLLDGEDVFGPTRAVRHADLSRHLAFAQGDAGWDSGGAESVGSFAFDAVAERFAAAAPNRGTLDRRQHWPELRVPAPRPLDPVQAAKMTVPLEDAAGRLARAATLLDRFAEIELLPVADSTFCLVRRDRLALPTTGFFTVKSG